ncbi:hypothetical protein FQA39_LY07329 [Lamprigera yunnana]|nr:hypothetical protein FQA39_LY07329 [Lamprigera yunnana]
MALTYLEPIYSPCRYVSVVNMEYKNEDHLTNVHHDSARKCSGWIPVRITLYILCLSGIIITYMMNLTINLLIPSFVKQHPSELTKIHITERLCYLPKNYSHSVAANDETFNWSLDVQRYVVTSYYASYIILQLVGGIVVQYFGSKAAFGYGIFISALSNLFVPLAHNVHYICAVTLQTFQGAAHGLIWPCVFRSVNQWVPVQERSRFLTCIHGIFLGTALSHAVLRPLIVKIGWIYAYYVTGSIGLLWVLFWYLWAYDTPEIHPRITSNELQHIQKNRGKILQHKKSIPWKCIFSSMPVWAIVVACFGRMWLISTAVLYWNKYLEAVRISWLVLQAIAGMLQQSRRTASRILGLTALAAKTDRTGLIGAECTCIYNSLRTVSLTKALASHSNRMVEFQVTSRRGAGKYLLRKARTATGKSSEERGSSIRSVKSAFTIYWLPLYLLKFPLYNLPLAQVIIDTINKANMYWNIGCSNSTIQAIILAVTTKGCPEFMNRLQSGFRLINHDSNG